MFHAQDSKGVQLQPMIILCITGSEPDYEWECCYIVTILPNRIIFERGRCDQRTRRKGCSSKRSLAGVVVAGPLTVGSATSIIDS
jgi:hypothetical protein